MSDISIHNLSIHHASTPLLDNISLELSSSHITALLGPSGSGKSLLASALAGFVASNLSISGTIHAPLSKALIMQNPRTAFDPLFSIKSTIYETLRAKSIRIERSSISSVLASVSLEPSVLELYPHECSGGMLQRVMIAIALLSRAQYLIADEITSDLDLLSQAAVLDILSSLRGRIGILLITHDFGVVARLASMVHIIDHGRIIESATTKDIFAHPLTPLAKQLISAHLALYGDNHDTP